MGAANISIRPGGEKTPTKEPPKGKNPSTTREPTQTEERGPRASTEDQRDHSTESHRIPTIEVPYTKTTSKAKHQEVQKQKSHLEWGDKKRTCNQKEWKIPH